MSQYIALLTLPVLATQAITAHRFVTVTGGVTGIDGNALGVANASGASGTVVPVICKGTAIVETGTAVSHGATIRSDPFGRAIPWAGSGPRLAIALQTATSAGQFIECVLLDNAA